MSEPASPRAEAPQAPSPAFDRRLFLVMSLVWFAQFVCLTADPVVNNDLWHQMALIRESRAQGSLLTADPYAFTPTLPRFIQHEWGAGVIALYVAEHFGIAGLWLLNYGLELAFTALLLGCLFRRRVDPRTLLLLSPIAVALFVPGFYSPVRAQSFSFLLFVALLAFLELDRRGNRWWITAWLPLLVVWLNVHAGFFAGLGMLGAYAVERAWNRQPFAHLAVVLLVSAAAVAINPYGLEYYGYLAEALTMRRPRIGEWSPVWRCWPEALFFAASLLLFAYAAWKKGPRRMAGFLVVLVTAIAAARALKMLPIYGIAWAWFVPAHLQDLRIGEALGALWQRRRRVAVSLLGVACVWAAANPISIGGFSLGVPGVPLAGPNGFTYPVGPVDYLREAGFRGNVATHFGTGAYVLWKLFPDAKVSCDSRYETAYPSSVVEENFRLYGAHEGWQEILRDGEADVVIVEKAEPLASALPSLTGWRRVYEDDAHDVYAREGSELPLRDRRGERIFGSFP